jgi:hypothetical protein
MFERFREEHSFVYTATHQLTYRRYGVPPLVEQNGALVSGRFGE